jgi:hypothetical protein
MVLRLRLLVASYYAGKTPNSVPDQEIVAVPRVMKSLAMLVALLVGSSIVGWSFEADAASSHRRHHTARAVRSVHPARAAHAVSHDGNWSVVIVTERGTCDSGYRFLLGVANGRISYYGGGPVSISGTVSRSGYVRVSIRASGKGANGSGRLLSRTGRGSWRGRGSSGPCAGHWEAQRS